MTTTSRFIAVAAGLVLMAGCGGQQNFVRRALPAALFSYEPWNRVLATHVDKDGYVDFDAVKRDSAFWTYIAMVNGAEPSRLGSVREQLAFWINAYNALTIQLVVDNYPVSSITDIAGGLTGAVIPGAQSPWDLTVANIEGDQLTLKQIETDRLRALGDERINFAINSSAIACPKLMPKAFTAENLDDMLAQSRREFLANRRQNYLKDGRLYLSKIFDWHRKDFVRAAGSLQAYVARYWPDAADSATIATLPDSQIEFLDYNWRLVSQRNRAR